MKEIYKCPNCFQGDIQSGKCTACGYERKDDKENCLRLPEMLINIYCDLPFSRNHSIQEKLNLLLRTLVFLHLDLMLLLNIRLKYRFTL